MSTRPPSNSSARRRQEFSIVEYFAGNSGSRCGYCGSQDSNYSRGMWAHKLMTQDYQDLIDRGWRRSGKYVYKPSMDIMCCPAYAIRCEALQCKASKSQKKILVKVCKYLKTGSKPAASDPQKPEDQKPKQEATTSVVTMETKEAIPPDSQIPSSTKDVSGAASNSSNQTNSMHSSRKKSPRPGDGPDPSKALQKKAKVLRMEAKHQKRQQSTSAEAGLESEATARVQNTNEPKSIETYLSEEKSQSSCHTLKLRLVRSYPPSSEFQDTLEKSFVVYKRFQETIHKDPPDKCTLQQIKLIRTKPASLDFQESFNKSYEIFRKYQMTIHKEPASECTEDDFKRFLCESPLEEEYSDDGPTCGYGSFHHQYWLDDQLVAVGVLDILPHCVSSVYFYYNPDYSFLTLGTYSALREVAFTREIQKEAADIKYYYMGFYIHSCQKMRYKGQISCSFLLCPEAYTWQPIEDCRSKLDENKYSRLDPTNASDTEVDVDKVLTLHKGQAMPYSIYTMLKGENHDKEDVAEYAKLAGHVCAYRMLLYRA